MSDHILSRAGRVYGRTVCGTQTAVDSIPRAQGSSSADAVTVDDSHTPTFLLDVRGAEITSLVDRPQKSCEVLMIRPVFATAW